MWSARSARSILALSREGGMHANKPSYGAGGFRNDAHNANGPRSRASALPNRAAEWQFRAQVSV